MISIYDKNRVMQTGSRERYKRSFKELKHEEGVKRELSNANKKNFEVFQFTDIRGVTYIKIRRPLKFDQIVRITKKV